MLVVELRWSQSSCDDHEERTVARGRVRTLVMCGQLGALLRPRSGGGRSRKERERTKDESRSRPRKSRCAPAPASGPRRRGPDRSFSSHARPRCSSFQLVCAAATSLSRAAAARGAKHTPTPPARHRRGPKEGRRAHTKHGRLLPRADCRLPPAAARSRDDAPETHPARHARCRCRRRRL